MNVPGIGLALGMALLLAANAALAQPTTPTRPTTPTQPTDPTEIAVAPIECWWRTDRSAVRVGEHFNLTLTCAVLDTDRVRVEVDESGLAPSALNLVPFETVDGRRFRDIQHAPRRFFQYQYTMRLLGEEFFGKEVALPRLQIGYRVQNALQGGSALAGRERQYALTPVPIRVVSLVPPGTSDIRDASIETFGDVEARLFRSNLLLIAAALAFVLAALMGVLLFAREAVSRRSAATDRPRTVSSGAVIRAALRELGAVRAISQSDGWSSELAGRAAAALRLAGAIALSRPVGQKDVDRSSPPTEGQVPMAPGLRALRGRKTMLSAAVTPGTAANGHGGAAALWQSISQPLGVFTLARYSRASADGNGEIGRAALDAALAEGESAIRRLRFAQLRRFGRTRRPAHMENVRQAWER